MIIYASRNLIQDIRTEEVPSAQSCYIDDSHTNWQLIGDTNGQKQE